MATSLKGKNKRKAAANSTAASRMFGGSDAEASGSSQPRKKQRRETDEVEHTNDYETVTEATEPELGASNKGDSDEEYNGGFPDVEDDEACQHEQDGDKYQARPIPPTAPAPAALAPVSAPAPPPVAVALTELQRFTALRQIHPNVPNPQANPIGFQLFAQVTEGKRRFATHSPENDMGTQKVVGGKCIPDCALVLIHDHLFRGLVYDDCRQRYLLAGGGRRGATYVSDNALSKCVKLWAPRWYDHHNLVWPWRLLATDREMCQALKAAGLTDKHFPQSIIRQPTTVNQLPASVGQRSSSAKLPRRDVSDGEVSSEEAPSGEVHLGGGRDRFEASTAFQEESEQAVETLLQQHFEGVVARLAPLSNQVDPAEMLMNPHEAHSVPRSVARLYIPIVKDHIHDLQALSGPRWELFEFAIHKVKLLLVLLEMRDGI